MNVYTCSFSIDINKMKKVLKDRKKVYLTSNLMKFNLNLTNKNHWLFDCNKSCEKKNFENHKDH